MAESDTILQLGIDAAREGNRDEARNLFSLLTRQEPGNLQAWLWLAGVADSPDERRVALERVLELDPTNDMAIKGLQNMGMSTLPESRPAEGRATTAEPRASTIPAAAARELTDEERYAAELDSAFDDYDSVPKAEAPPRREPDFGLDTGAATEPRISARQRSAARRGPTPVRSERDDEMRPDGGSRGSGNLRRILLGAIGVVVVLLLLFLLLRRGDNSGIAGNGGNGGTAEIATATVEGGAGTNATLPPTAERPPTAELAPTSELPPTPEAAPPTAPPAADISNANPQPVAVGAELSANGWRFTFPGICLGSCATVLGPQVSNFTAKGTYVVVLVLVANDTGTAQPIPADFFVIKDAQGRIYNALPQVSSAYAQPGINADISMETPVPANGTFTSVPLLFDIEHGATNLMLFARSKPDQGWPVLDSVP
ncbi:MAG: tetratricopeptide repeat protein [Roseiflexaceae bacterium]